MFWFLKLFFVIFLTSSYTSYHSYIHEEDEKTIMPYYIKKEVKDFHYNYVCKSYWKILAKDPNWTSINDEVIDHYYGKINGIYVISVYNTAVQEVHRLLDWVSTTEIYGKYKIIIKIEYQLYLKINNTYYKLSEAYKNNLIDNDTLYDIYVENCHLFDVKPIKKVD